MIEIKVKGDKMVRMRLENIGSAIIADAQSGLYKASKYLRDMAIIDLQNKVGSGNWPTMGMSADGTSIRNKSNWTVDRLSPYAVDLRCFSPHASIVETGGITKSILDAREYGHNAWPIGRHQGADEIYRRFIRVQSGYHYLQTSIMNPTVQQGMTSIIGHHIAEIVRGIGI